MFDNKNIKSYKIERQGNKFLVSWEYVNAVTDPETGDNIKVVETSATNYYEALAHFINPFLGFNFETLKKESLMLNSQIDPDWEFIDEYRKREGISRQAVYGRIKSGILKSMKLSNFTLVRESKS